MWDNSTVLQVEDSTCESTLTFSASSHNENIVSSQKKNTEPEPKHFN